MGLRPTMCTYAQNLIRPAQSGRARRADTRLRLWPGPQANTMTRLEMKTSTNMQEAFDLAEHALVLAIQATDNALGEAIEHGCCATEYPDFVTAVMEFAGRIYVSEQERYH